MSEATRISSKRASEHFDPAEQSEQRLDHGVVFTEMTEATYGSRRTSLAAWGSNPDHHSALAILALNHAAHADRAPQGRQRYVRRKGGKFTKSQDDVGRSLVADRRKRAKRVVKSGEGDRGDRLR